MNLSIVSVLWTEKLYFEPLIQFTNSVLAYFFDQANVAKSHAKMFTKIRPPLNSLAATLSLDKIIMRLLT